MLLPAIFIALERVMKWRVRKLLIRGLQENSDFPLEASFLV
jgi:hypothetical protein